MDQDIRMLLVSPPRGTFGSLSTSQDETNTYTDVPCPRHELQSVQEDGNLRTFGQSLYLPMQAEPVPLTARKAGHRT